MLEEKCDAKCTLAHRCILLYYIKIVVNILNKCKTTCQIKSLQKQ